MSSMELHHFGIACASLAEGQQEFEKLGYTADPQGPFADPQHGVRGLFMTQNGMRVELLEPLGEHSPVQSFLKRGIKIYHQCFRCDDLEQTLAALVADGALVVSPAKPGVCFAGKAAAFVMTPQNTLLELVQK